MARTVYYVAASLDGFIADEHDSLDWLFAQDVDPEGPLGYDDFIRGVGAVVMGRTTYDWLGQNRELSGEAWPYAIPTFVFTHTRAPDVDGADVRFATDEVAADYPAISSAAADRDIWIVGGGDLAAQFAEAGLLDEVLISIAPVTLGAGRPLFPRRFDLALTSLARNRSFACARYSVVGARSN